MGANVDWSKLLQEFGFKWDGAREWFVHTTPGREVIFYVTENVGASVRVSPVAAVRFEQVETILHRVSGVPRDIQKQTFSVGIDLWRIWGEACRLQTTSDWQSRADAQHHLLTTFQQYAQPYHEQFKTIADVDRAVNDSALENCIHRALPWLRCTTGIIAAKLVKRPGYPELREIYKERMATLNKGFYLARFLKLLELLESY